jgi:hypothetical protein
VGVRADAVDDRVQSVSPGLVQDMRAQVAATLPALIDVEHSDAPTAFGVAELFGNRPRALQKETLEEVARVYRDAHKLGRNPRQAVRGHFDLRSDSGAAKRIRAARDARLLGPTSPGKAGE